MDINKEIAQGLVLVDFYAPWCQPCKALAPLLEIVAKETGAKLVSVNIDEDRDLATKFDIHAIPVVVLFKDGQEVKRCVGLQTKTQLKQLFADAQ